MNQQRGAWYEEMIDLYDRFVEGSLQYHYTSYFPELKKYYEEGELITKIHALELILNIVLGGKWTGMGTRPPTPKLSSKIGKIQYQILQIENRLSGRVRGKAEKRLNERSQDLLPVPIETIIGWLEETLPQETEEHVLKVFFIFIKTHWEHLMMENEFFGRMYKLHKSLLHNKKYAKLELLEQIHRNAFSSHYNILR